jgi:hypothetical protein
MRVMVFVKASRESEAGVLPSTEIIAAMTKYNEELVKAGVMLAAEGLAAELEGRAGQIRGKQADRNGWPVP